MKKLIEFAMFMQPKKISFPYSWVGHIPFAAWLVTVRKPTLLVELGTHSGNSYFAFCQAILENDLPTKCFAIDLWGGDEHAGFYDSKVFDELTYYHNQNYSSFSRLMRMTFDDALNEFADGTVDLLHIDGLHTYEAVKHDYDTWLPKMSENGIILFHDISVHERGFGVSVLWEELKSKYSTIEFPQSNGLGVVFLGNRPCPEIRELLEQERNEHSSLHLKQLFIQLGESIVTKYEKVYIEHIIIDKDKYIEQLMSSYSWRITKPIRWLAASIKSIKI